jgi:hypothetical protein
MKRTKLKEARRLATAYAGEMLVMQSIDSDPGWLDDYVHEDDVAARKAFHDHLCELGHRLKDRAANALRAAQPVEREDGE